MRLPDTVTIGSRDLPLGARGLEGMTFRVRYTPPLRFRIWLALRLMSLAVWLIGGEADIAPEEST